MNKSTRKNIFDYLSFFIIIIMIIVVLIEIYPLINDPQITILEIKNSLIVPGILLLLHIIIRVISGELLWLSNTMESLEGLPFILLILLVVIGIAYSINKDKMYFDFAKVVFGSFAGAFTQKRISSKKE